MEYTSQTYVNTKRAAHYTGLSESLLEKRRCSGDGPIYSQIGKAVRYLVSDLDAWMQANRRTSTADLVEVSQAPSDALRQTSQEVA